MSSKKLSENEKLLILIDKLSEKQGTNFHRCFSQHLAIIHKYLDSARKKETNCFPDRETYQAFSCAKLFFDKLQFAVFQKPNETQITENEDDGFPPLEAFHSTADEIIMNKNRILKRINKGDVFHLKVISETDEHYNLRILNKYGEKQRIYDCDIRAHLIKSNILVKNIIPPLQIDDLVRATAFGNIKQEYGQYKQLIVSLNSNLINDSQLKPLHLGRVYKKDIPYYPEDISDFESFGQYLKANNHKFMRPENIVKQMISFGCDPSKSGPLYETRYKKQIPNDCDRMLAKEAQNLDIHCDKTRQANDLLKKDHPINALVTIQEALDLYYDNDVALTIRGKIYLALAGGQPSQKMKKAFLDFEAALKMNEYNEEAAELRDSILMESACSFTEKNMLEKVKKLQNYLGKRSLKADTQEFLKSIKERHLARAKASSSVEAAASSSHPGLVPKLKDEPMEV